MWTVLNAIFGTAIGLRKACRLLVRTRSKKYTGGNMESVSSPIEVWRALFISLR